MSTAAGPQELRQSPQTFRLPPELNVDPSHVLKGHSSIAQGSPRSGHPGVGKMYRGPNSTRRIHRGNRTSIRFPQSLREANSLRVQAPMGCPLPRVAAARQSWAMEEFPFRERTRPGRCALEPAMSRREMKLTFPIQVPLNNRNPFGVRAAIDRLRFGTFAVSGRSPTAITDQVIPSRVLNWFCSNGFAQLVLLNWPGRAVRPSRWR